MCRGCQAAGMCGESGGRERMSEKSNRWPRIPAWQGADNSEHPQREVEEVQYCFIVWIKYKQNTTMFSNISEDSQVCKQLQGSTGPGCGLFNLFKYYLVHDHYHYNVCFVSKSLFMPKMLSIMPWIWI